MGLDQPRPSDILPPLPGLEELPEGPVFTLPEIPAAPEQAPLSQGPRFRLAAVQFEGNSVFTRDELAAVAAPYLGRDVAAEELESLRRELTRHYIDAGYINSGAVLPDQTIADGGVTFMIVEGTLGEVSVEGPARLDPAYIESRLRRAAGPPLNINELQRRLRLLLDDPLIRRIDAELQPGLRPGDSRLEVRIEEEPLASAVFFVDNARQESVGGEQAGVVLTLRNPSGWGELLTVSSSVAEGFFEIGGRAEIAITPWDTRLAVRAKVAASKIVEEPFDLLDIESTTGEVGIELRQPLYREPGQELAATLSFDRRSSRNSLLGQGFSFSEGVEDGVSRVSVFRGTLDWLDRNQDQVIALRGTTSLGVGLFGATDNPGSIPDSEFVSFLGQAQYVRRLGPSDIRLVVRGEAQWTEDRLLSLEKFAVGGVRSVRGYREDFNIGDKGWNASIEGRIPVFDLTLPFIPPEQADGRVELVPFFDAGRAWDNTGAKNDTLASVGLGFTWAITRSVQTEFYYGYRLKDVDDPDDKGPQDHGIHFSVSMGF